MSQVKVVTDSAAELSPQIVEDLGITVVPWRIRLGSEVVTDDPRFLETAFHKNLARKGIVPTALPPNREQFAQVYQELARETDQIVSVHTSSELSTVVQAARQGSRSLLGRCRIDVIDSLFISRALGLLVTEVARACQEGATGEGITRLVGNLISRIYFAFCVETLDHLKRRGFIRDVGLSESGLSRSLLLFEDGEITSLRQSRSRGAPVERLVDFVTEFQDMEYLSIVHTGLGPGIKGISSLLAEDLPEQDFAEHIYGPVLSSYIGPLALGVVIFEEAF
ncbi:MAG: DegV family protein [Chloroflexota bacterium]|nr:DegV family protein [Chloroflexota bacterium]